MKSIKIHFPFLIAVLAVMAVLLAIALFRMEIDTDVTNICRKKIRSSRMPSMFSKITPSRTV